MLLRCRTPGPTENAVSDSRLLLVARMADQLQRMLKNCKRCIWHEVAQSKVPLHLIIFMAPLELLPIDYMSIEMTMELYKPPKVMNLLVFQDHFTKHVMVYVTPNQTTKTVAKFLYQGYILIFGVMVKLLSEQGPNFRSNIIWELCELMGITKIRTSLCHGQTNGQVECTHKTIMWMIGKLSEDQKADWPNHLSEMVKAYNSTRSGVTEFSPHYLMSGWRPKDTSRLLLPKCERSRKAQTCW